MESKEIWKESYSTSMLVWGRDEGMRAFSFGPEVWIRVWV